MATYTSSMQQRQQWAAAMVKHYRLASHASAQYRTLPALLNQLLRAGLITQAVHDDTLQQPQEKPQTVLAVVQPSITKPSMQCNCGAPGCMVDAPAWPSLAQAPETVLPVLAVQQHDAHVLAYQAHGKAVYQAIVATLEDALAKYDAQQCVQHDEHVHQYQAAHYELVCQYKAKRLSGHGLCHKWKYGTLAHKLAVCTK